MENKGKTCPEGKYGKGEKIKKTSGMWGAKGDVEDKVRRDRGKGYRGKMK